jgi:hypothetical protein
MTSIGQNHGARIKNPRGHDGPKPGEGGIPQGVMPRRWNEVERTGVPRTPPNTIRCEVCLDVPRGKAAMARYRPKADNTGWLCPRDQ